MGSRCYVPGVVPSFPFRSRFGSIAVGTVTPVRSPKRDDTLAARNHGSLILVINS